MPIKLAVLFVSLWAVLSAQAQNYGSSNAGRLRNVLVAPIAPADGAPLVYNGATHSWQPASNTKIDPTNGVFSPERDRFNRFLNFQAVWAKYQRDVTAYPTLTFVGADSVDNEYVSGPVRNYFGSVMAPMGAGYVGLDTLSAVPSGVSLTTTGTWTECRQLAACVGVQAADVSSTDIATPAKKIVTATVNTYVIHYLLQPGGGSFTYQVDSGSVITINTANATVAYATQSITIGFVYVSHTLTLAVTAAGTAGVKLMGVEAQIANGNFGVRVNRVSSPGSTAAMFAALNQPLWQAGMTALGSTVVSFSWGVYELQSNATPASHSAALTTLAASVRTALPSADVLLLSTADVGASGTYTMAQYVAAQRDVARANGCVFIDSTKNLGTYAAANARGLMTDSTHLNGYGGQVIANTVISALMEGLLPLLGQNQVTLGRLYVANQGFGNTSLNIKANGENGSSGVDLFEIMNSTSVVQVKFDYQFNLTLVPQKATTGTRYLCIDTSGKVTSSASACSGT